MISTNGIKHKSKQINITWADIPDKNPKTIERIVFGTFASYESAKKQAEKLKDKGYETTVAYPKNWEVWIPIQDELPEFELKNKIFRKIKNFQITPVLRNDYSGMKLEGPIYIYSEEKIKINLLWFSPIFTCGNIDAGYDVIDYYNVNKKYGTWKNIKLLEQFLQFLVLHFG